MVVGDLSLIQEKIKKVNLVQDLEGMIQDLNIMSKNPFLESKYKKDLNRVKQRAYERKFHLKKEGTGQEIKHHVLEKKNNTRNLKEILLALLSFLASLLLWSQSIEIYQSLGFSSPHLVAVGAIIMTIGFSYFSASSKKMGANIMSGVVILYEALLMTSGTILNETDMGLRKIKEGYHYAQLIDNHKKYQNEYEVLKVKYFDKGSQLYMNSWFKKQHLNPVMDKNQEALKALVDFEEQAQKDVLAKNYVVIFLKILYRICLVVLLIFSSSALMRIFIARQ